MSEASGRRFAGLDIARGLAVLAMFAFHFVWDLSYFGYIDASIPYSRGVKFFGHAIAFAFLFIAGVSLVLAHDNHPRWRPFWRRFAIIVGAAALVSAGTYVAFPKSFVFFGILHCIAVASLLSAPFLFLPWQASLAAAALAGVAPFIASNSFFDTWPWWWTGLSTFEPATNDYRPLLPWLGAMLLGVAATQALRERSLISFGSASNADQRRWFGSAAIASRFISSISRRSLPLSAQSPCLRIRRSRRRVLRRLVRRNAKQGERMRRCAEKHAPARKRKSRASTFHQAPRAKKNARAAFGRLRKPASRKRNDARLSN